MTTVNSLMSEILERVAASMEQAHYEWTRTGQDKPLRPLLVRAAVKATNELQAKD